MRFTRNVSSNLASYVVGVAVALLLCPFLVRSLGVVYYGLWAVVNSLTGYYGLLDFGLRGGVGTYIARYWAKRDVDGVNRTINTTIVLGIGFVVLAMGATITLSLLLPRIIDATADAQWALFVTGTGLAVSFPFAIFALVLSSVQRFDLQAGVGVTSRIIGAILTVWVLNAGYGILGLALVTAGVDFLGLLVRVWMAFRLIPGLRLAPSMFSRQSVREVGHYGFFSFLSNLADRVLLHADAIVIGAILGASAVTMYVIGANLIPYYVMIVAQVAWVLTPYASGLDARGDREALRRLLYHGTRGATFLAAVIGAGLVLMGHDFLRIWMGEGYDLSAAVLGVLAVAMFVRQAQTCGLQVLFGMRRVGFVAAMAVAEVIMNITLSLVLIRVYGIIGVAYATLISMIPLRGFVLGVVVVRLVGVSGWRYTLTILRASVPPVLAMTLTFMAVDRAMPVTSWGRFAAKCVVVALPALVAGFFLLLNGAERRAVIDRVLSRPASPSPAD